MKKILYKAALLYLLITGSGFLMLSLYTKTEPRILQWLEYGLVLLVCLLFFLLFVYQHTKLITGLNQQARSFAEGDFTVRVANFADDELGQLSNSMQNMAKNLHCQIRETLREKGQMETILASMVEGVLAFDATGRLLLINKTAEEMLDIVWEKAHEHYFLEIFRNRQIASCLNKCLVDGQVQTAEVQLVPEGSEYYQVYITPIRGDNEVLQGAVMVLRNITQLRQLEQMRSEFISNVSHELRTPLTSLKGFVETLLDGAVDDRAAAVKFLSIINTETDRMNTLISDLLFLSRLESGDMEVVKEQVESEILVDEVLALLQPVAQHKKIKLEREIHPGAESFFACYEMIEQVLINLVDNAIKYSFENEEVKVICRPMMKEEGERAQVVPKEMIVIEVIDRGMGIPGSSVSRLFERFYRVDKARSRQVGGTGLGLSIVKHIVERHHGRVQVKSKENHGSVFMIFLPKV